MTQQPEALRLAFVIEGGWDREHGRKAAAEMRRLHEVEVAYGVMMAQAESRITTLEDALRQALEALDAVYGKGKKCEAAITAAKQALGEE
jgi:hypothetical protein